MQAVCCDPAYCCESGYRCESGQCYKDGEYVPASTITPALLLISHDERPNNELQTSVTSVICPDQISYCPDGTTCCPIGSGKYGCCPFPQVCVL